MCRWGECVAERKPAPVETHPPPWVEVACAVRRARWFGHLNGQVPHDMTSRDHLDLTHPPRMQSSPPRWLYMFRIPDPKLNLHLAIIFLGSGVDPMDQKEKNPWTQVAHSCQLKTKEVCITHTIHGTGIFTYIGWLNFMVNVGKYSIRRWYG